MQTQAGEENYGGDRLTHVIHDRGGGRPRRRGLFLRLHARRRLRPLRGVGRPPAPVGAEHRHAGDGAEGREQTAVGVEDDGGSFRVLNLPFRMSGARVAAGRRMATLGEHTRVLLKEAGMSEEKLAELAGKPLLAGRN